MKDNRINGMILPVKLILAIGDGTWTATGRHWKNIFPRDEIVHPKLYSFDLMKKVNSTWRNESHPAFVGVADGRAKPGNLVPGCSLLVGELQGDAMIALDYRGDNYSPSVVYLNLEGLWVVVAENFDNFWHHLADSL
jgi:hypothetical protein